MLEHRLPNKPYTPKPLKPVVREEKKKDEGKVPETPNESPEKFDKVDQASWESFPASDSPGW